MAMSEFPPGAVSGSSEQPLLILPVETKRRTPRQKRPGDKPVEKEEGNSYARHSVSLSRYATSEEKQPHA